MLRIGNGTDGSEPFSKYCYYNLNPKAAYMSFFLINPLFSVLASGGVDTKCIKLNNYEGT